VAAAVVAVLPSEAFVVADGGEVEPEPRLLFPDPQPINPTQAIVAPAVNNVRLVTAATIGLSPLSDKGQPFVSW